MHAFYFVKVVFSGVAFQQMVRFQNVDLLRPNLTLFANDVSTNIELDRSDRPAVNDADVDAVGTSFAHSQ